MEDFMASGDGSVAAHPRYFTIYTALGGKRVSYPWFRVQAKS